MRYIDVCSGISAPTVAWKPLGWEALCFAEIEPAPRAVLAHHYPNVPLRGDFTEIEGTEYGPVDLLVGGTPCQSFSIAGLRGGLGDDRGNLALEFARLADRARPRWVVWENVPGVLSSNGGRDFGSILGALGELGYGVAYRVLDAQHFGVPQRRRRVFVVGYLGDWRRAAAVLFERHSLSGHPAPRRETGQGIAGTLKARAGKSGTPNGAEEADRLVVTHSLRGEGFDASEDGTGRGTPLVPVCVPIDMRQASRGATMTNNRVEGSSGGAPGTGIGQPGDPAPTVSTSHVAAVAFVQNSRDEVRLFGDDGKSVGALAAEPGMKQQCYVAFAIQERAVSENIEAGPQGKGFQEGVAYTLEARNKVQSVAANAVRRLTPRECERLQGFPDDFTLVPHRGKPMADSPRYKMLGNSMAVPVLRWIGERIQMVERITETVSAAA